MNESLIYHEPMPSEGSLLLAALSRRAPDVDAAWRRQVVDTGVDRLRTLAEANRVEMAVGHALGDLASSDWQRAIGENTARVQALVTLVGETCGALEACGIVSACFESGGVLVASTLPFGAFGSGDVDLLITPNDWEPTLNCLAGLGFVSRERRAEGVHRCELQVEREGHALYLDVARMPFERMTAPLPFVNRTDVWLGRRVRSERDERVYTLSPEDLLVQVAVHTSLHQYVLSPGLRLHMDVERLVRDHALDWDCILREVAEVGLRTRVFVSLSMASGLLGASVPSEVLEALAPSPARWAALRELVASASVLAGENAKFRGLDAVRLDRLLDDRGAAAWLGGLAWPSTTWLRPRLERDGPVSGPDWLLHGHRARRLVRRLLRRG